MSGKSEMTAWKSVFFCDLPSANVFGTPRGRGKCHLFFRQNIFSRLKFNERKSPKADVLKVRLGLSANNLGESVQMYLVLKKSRLVFMETSVVLFRRSFLFRSTNRNWSAQRGISPEKWRRLIISFGNLFMSHALLIFAVVSNGK